MNSVGKPFAYVCILTDCSEDCGENVSDVPGTVFSSRNKGGCCYFYVAITKIVREGWV